MLHRTEGKSRYLLDDPRNERFQLILKLIQLAQLIVQLIKLTHIIQLKL